MHSFSQLQLMLVKMAHRQKHPVCSQHRIQKIYQIIISAQRQGFLISGHDDFKVENDNCHPSRFFCSLFWEDLDISELYLRRQFRHLVLVTSTGKQKHGCTQLILAFTQHRRHGDWKFLQFCVWAGFPSVNQVGKTFLYLPVLIGCLCKWGFFWM